MVGSIKNRIAAFEDLAIQSKTVSKVMDILPPEPGFSASIKIAKDVRAKETYGFVPPPPLKVKPPPLKVKSPNTSDRKKIYSESRTNRNEQFKVDLDAYENFLSNNRNPAENDENSSSAVETTELVVSNDAKSNEGMHDSAEGSAPVIQVKSNDSSGPAPVIAVKSDSSDESFDERDDLDAYETSRDAKKELNDVGRAQLPDYQEDENNEPSATEANKSVASEDTDSFYDGPVHEIAVMQSKSSDGFLEEREDHNISPLSFQGAKIASRRDAAPYVPGVPVIEEETLTSLGAEDFMVNHADSFATPIMSNSTNDLTDVFSEVDNEDLRETSFDRQEDEYRNAETIEDLREENDLSVASERDSVTLNSGLSETVNDVGLAVAAVNDQEESGERIRNTDSPSIHDDYDNFTLGSGESGDFFDAQNVDDQPEYNQGEGADSQGIAISAQEAYGQNAHTIEYGQSESEPIEPIEPKQTYVARQSNHRDMDPFFLDDDSTVESSRAKSDGERSFSAYVDNLLPVPAPSNDNDSADNYAYSIDESSEGINDGNTVEEYFNNLLPAPASNSVDYLNDMAEMGFEDNYTEQVDNSTNTNHIDEESSVELKDGILIGGEYAVNNVDDTNVYYTEEPIQGGLQESNIAESDNGELNNYTDTRNNGDADKMPFDEGNYNIGIGEQDMLMFQGPTSNMNDSYDVLDRGQDASSPVYYPEEDFFEDDYDEDEMDDDETSDLLGIGFDELSLTSDAQDSNFINPVSVKRPDEYAMHAIPEQEYSMQDDYDPISQEENIVNPKGPESFSREEYKRTQNKLEEMKRKSQNRKHENYDSEGMQMDVSNTYLDPLAAIQEDQSPGKLAPYLREASTGPPLTIRNGYLPNNDDAVSQMTETTSESEQIVSKWRASQQQEDQTIQETKSSDHSSLMTYSLTESSNVSIVQSKTNNAPIFRKRNSLSDNPRLNSTQSNISEITDPLAGRGQRKRPPAKGRTPSKRNSITAPSITSGSTPKKNDSSRRRSPSPFGRMDSAKEPDSSKRRSPSPFGRLGRSKEPQPDSADGIGRTPYYATEPARGRQTKNDGRSKRGFSLRSLSPFRRFNTKKDLNHKLQSAQDVLIQSQQQSQHSRARIPRRNRSQSPFRQISPTRSGSMREIMQEDEARETSIPLVAITLSDDSAERQKPIKKWSFRNFSPFRRRNNKKSSVKVDPFDEGDNSL